ncbi:hypothetical protein ACEZCY_17305 [Streptacidiphilus sp. N1-12]|uniref:ATP-binding protein n=2 Tax=Streptacidiphilus alkalitolerans TaxID=3342712 RepID=A0ABV6WG22_9ACTN
MGAVPLPSGLAAGAFLVLGALAVQPAAAWAAEPTASSVPVTSLQQPQVGPALAGLTGATDYAAAPLKTLRLDPLAASSADPLSNGVALQPDQPGVKPLSTTAVTGSLSQGGGLDSLPLVGGLAKVLPGG